MFVLVSIGMPPGHFAIHVQHIQDLIYLLAYQIYSI